MAISIGRRRFISALGGAAAPWPLAAQAQQTALPVVGYLNYGSPTSENPSRLKGLRDGLNETGHVEGHNFVILSNPAGQKINPIHCPRWQQIRSNVELL